MSFSVWGHSMATPKKISYICGNVCRSCIRQTRDVEDRSGVSCCDIERGSRSAACWNRVFYGTTHIPRCTLPNAHASNIRHLVGRRTASMLRPPYTSASSSGYWGHCDLKLHFPTSLGPQGRNSLVIIVTRSLSTHEFALNARVLSQGGLDIPNPPRF
jgi:hypothetical protein